MPPTSFISSTAIITEFLAATPRSDNFPLKQPEKPTLIVLFQQLVNKNANNIR